MSLASNQQMLDNTFHFERGKISVRPLESARTDGAEWLRVSPQRRIEAVEFLRADFVGINYATQRLSRFLSVARQA